MLLRSDKSRRGSVLNPAELVATPLKRNSLALYEPVDASPSTPLGRSGAREETPHHQNEIPFPASPVTPATPLRREVALPGGTPQSILLRRASPWHRAVIDDYLIFSEEISLVRLNSEQAKTMPSPSVGSGPIRNRLSMRDASVLKRRRSYVDVNGLGHSRAVSTSSQKEENRMSFATVSSKRSSLAGSIKRGLSLSSHDGQQDPWGASSSMLMSGSTLSSPVKSYTPLAVPNSPVDTTASSWPLNSAKTLDAVPPGPRRDGAQTQRHARSQSQGVSSQVVTSPERQSLPRKQSLTRLSSLFGRPKAERAYSLPSSPSVSNLPDADQELPDQGQSTARGYFEDTHHHQNGVYASGAGLSNVRPTTPTQQPSFLTRSMSFVKLASKGKETRSNPSSDYGGYDSRRGSVDTEPLASSVYSTPSGDHRGLESVPGSPSGLPGLPLNEVVANEFGATARPVAASNASSGHSTDTSTASKADHRPESGENSRPNQPKRRRSVRFLSSIKGFTSITGNPG